MVLTTASGIDWEELKSVRYKFDRLPAGVTRLSQDVSGALNYRRQRRYAMHVCVAHSALSLDRHEDDAIPRNIMTLRGPMTSGHLLE